jgi:hypothetical protein
MIPASDLSPGEDVYLAQEYVYALISGLQGGEDSRYLKVIADCKHFAGYVLIQKNIAGALVLAFIC